MWSKVNIQVKFARIAREILVKVPLLSFPLNF